jgi:hypothetical protein
VRRNASNNLRHQQELEIYFIIAAQAIGVATQVADEVVSRFEVIQAATAKSGRAPRHGQSSEAALTTA